MGHNFLRMNPTINASLGDVNSGPIDLTSNNQSKTCIARKATEVLITTTVARTSGRKRKRTGLDSIRYQICNR
jgi:hypothetical protein